ncbi:J domain-containing protein [Salinilacihabitans rarus]|uniref:J domain-containing protein n=1 Tax=Salinilacihabitans rarus TaxID=2961596 RepID=UPI0020C90835|nr:J domain-containing protein [Salinilacihabitans rarus]
MTRSRLILGLAATFAGLAAVSAIGAVVSGSPVALAVAAPLGVTSYVMYYHGSGRLERAVSRGEAGRRRRRDGGGFGAGPRTRGGARTGGSTGRSKPDPDGPSAASARRELGVGADADGDEIRRAYRERVKEVHPDRGGDRATFRRTTAAYERLRE